MGPPRKGLQTQEISEVEMNLWELSYLPQKSVFLPPLQPALFCCGSFFWNLLQTETKDSKQTNRMSGHTLFIVPHLQISCISSQRHFPYHNHRLPEWTISCTIYRWDRQYLLVPSWGRRITRLKAITQPAVSRVARSRIIRAKDPNQCRVCDNFINFTITGLFFFFFFECLVNSNLWADPFRSGGAHALTHLSLFGISLHALDLKPQSPCQAGLSTAMELVHAWKSSTGGSLITLLSGTYLLTVRDQLKTNGTHFSGYLGRGCAMVWAENHLPGEERCPWPQHKQARLVCQELQYVNTFRPGHKRTRTQETVCHVITWISDCIIYKPTCSRCCLF